MGPRSTFLALLVGIETLMFAVIAVPSHDSAQKACTRVIKANGNGTNDGPAIRGAFTTCKENGHIIFENTMY
jgi:hypothetical protein